MLCGFAGGRGLGNAQFKSHFFKGRMRCRQRWFRVGFFVFFFFEPGEIAKACCYSGTGRLYSRAVVLRLRFQRSVHLGICPSFANFVFCQIRTFK